MKTVSMQYISKIFCSYVGKNGRETWGNKHIRPSVSLGDWFQDSPQVPKSTGAEVQLFNPEAASLPPYFLVDP